MSDEASSRVTALARPARGGLAPVDLMQRYMREAERYPLLSREEERALAVRLRETGDPEAAFKLVTSNLRLVVKIAHEYRRSSFALVDLVQEGNIGLIQAVRKYDPAKGVKLSTYAAWWIRAYVLRYVMENWRLIKVGTTQAQRKLFFNLRKEQRRLEAMGIEPAPKLLAERLEVSEEEVLEMEQRLGSDEVSLNAPVGPEHGDGRATRADRLASQELPTDERLAEDELKELVRTKMIEFGARLKDRERYIFEHRLAAEEPKTLQEIGDHFGLTRERARQIEAKLVREFKAFVQEAAPDLRTLEVGYQDGD